MPDAVRGRVFTLLDLSWSAMRLLSLVLGGLIADVLGVRPLVWGSGSLLALTGVLGLVLLGRYDFRDCAADLGKTEGDGCFDRARGRASAQSGGHYPAATPPSRAEHTGDRAALVLERRQDDRIAENAWLTPPPLARGRRRSGFRPRRSDGRPRWRHRRWERARAVRE